MAEELRVGFVTCVQLGLDVMDEIYALGGELSLAVTLPDEHARAKSGRVFIDSFCDQRSIPLVKSPSVNDHSVIDSVRENGIDWLFIIGWSQIAGSRVLSAPRLGCIGMHPTLLPEGRGRASIPWAILKGLPETGVTMFVLDEGVDTGPILAATRIEMTPTTNATELYDKVQGAHKTLIREQWAALNDGALTAVPQDPQAGSVWPGRRPADGRIHSEMHVEDALRLVRATTHPYPGAFWEDGESTVRVWDANRTGTPGHRPYIRCRDGFVQAITFDLEGAEDAT